MAQNDDAPAQRTCKRCGDEKPLAEFKGRQQTCKACLKTGKLNPGADARLAERLSLELDMRKAGASYRAISAHLATLGIKVSPGQVYKDVQKALDAAHKKEGLKVKQLRQLENERYDAAQLAIWQNVLRGDVGAIWVFLAISAARCRLNGTNAPTEIKVDAREALAKLLGVPPDELPAKKGKAK